MRRAILFFPLFLLIILPALSLTPLEAETLEARVEIANTIILEPTGARYRVEEANAALTWFPRHTRLQQVLSMEVDPGASLDDERIMFNWESPSQSETIAVTSTVKTLAGIVPVRERVRFPLKDVPQEMEIYLGNAEIADQTPDIQRLAQELAAGKTDAYEVVFTLADWTTRNVEYSLVSMGQPAIQTSSQVLQSREGKCDELTALFISLNRALGIPARFVAGYSYTNSDKFAQEWGGHGWAEVWLPEQGWVPFDVTYGEYGYLDAGHITLKTAPDAKETSIDISARGRDFELRTQPLSISITPLRMIERTREDISIALEAPYDEVGFGSSALILAHVDNRNDYYVSTRLNLAKTGNTDLLSKDYENILLRPGETRTVPFLVKLDDNLRQGYAYDFPFRAYSRLGPSATIIIKSHQNAQVYDSSFFQEEMEQYTQAPVPQDFSVTCDRGDAAYIGESITHTCSTDKDTLTVCDSDRECSTVTGPKFTLTTTDATAGVSTREYTARSGDGISRFFVTSRTVMPTQLDARMGAPTTVTPREQFMVMVNLSSTGAVPQDLIIGLQAHNAHAEQELEVLSRPAILQFTVPGRELRPGENTITATVSYTDELGTEREEEIRTIVVQQGATALDKIGFWVEDAGYWVAGLFS
jgi:transglutaminase-like putative cysteine protease